MSILILIWLGLLALCLYLAGKGRAAGALLLGYFLGLSLIHVPGALNFVGNSGLSGEEETIRGFEATLVGMAALLSGALLQQVRGQVSRPQEGERPTAGMRNSGTLFLVAGIISYFLVTPLIGFIPSATALTSAIGSLVIVGIWVLLRDATIRKDSRRVLVIFATLPLLPMATLATGGFIGYGVYWLVAIISFHFSISRKRWIYIFIAPVVLYIGLSLGVAYFGERNGIREAVWQKNADLSERIDRILDMATSFEFYDWNDLSHTIPIDTRLNQNFLVGRGIMRHEQGDIMLLYGATVPWWTFVPRAVWSDKPEVGGGRDIVSEFTGIRFAPGTSVGAGQPLEFYANFGWTGIVVGFFVWGFILSWIDGALSQSFKSGNLRRILTAGLFGLALLQPGGNLLEILVAAAGALVAAQLMFVSLREMKLLQHDQSKRAIDPRRNQAYGNVG